jgi:HAE1 family hydrophobic/amphiphilic exporter-1
MLSRTSLPSFSRPQAAPVSLGLAAMLAVVLIMIPPSTAAASGRPVEGGSALVPGAALANAVLSVPQQQDAQPQQRDTQQSGPDLRAAASRDSEIIRDLVYQADERMPAGQRQAYELSLLDAVELALRNNLSVQVARYGPQSSFEGINASRAPFDTNLSFSIPSSFSRGTQPTTNQTQGGDVITSQGLNGGFQWSENLEWGTNYSLSWTSSRSSNNNQFATFNPSFSSGLRGQINQPLLQGFGEVNRTGIRVAMNSYDQSIEQFRGSVQNIIAQVVSAYWNLRGQAEGVRVQEESLELAEQQLARNEIQVEIGTLAPIETVQAETSVAASRLSLIQAQNQLENAQDQLKELINFDTVVDDPFAYDLVATEEPEQTVAAIDAEEAVSVALENDPQLIQQRIGLRSAELQLNQAENSLLPNLSVNASFNLQGRGGTRIIRSGGLGGEETEIIETGFGTAISQVFSGDFNTWSVGASLTFPLHNYSAKASAARARISQNQQMTQFEQRRQQITYDIRQQVRNVQNLVQQVQTATLRRELADRQLQAEQRKFEVGTTTNFQVLTFQRDFSNAQLAELQAIINLQGAIAQLELSKGTLLQYFGVQLGDAGTGGGQSPAPLPEPTNGGR